MSNCSQCGNKTNKGALEIPICYLTQLAPGNVFDPTRPGFVVVNQKDLKLGPIHKKCKEVSDSCGCHCEEQECATLTGFVFWTVSIPVLSLCAAPGSNTGYQSVSGLRMINTEICASDLSHFNPCNLSANLIEMKLQPDPCPLGSTLAPSQLVGGLVQGICCNPEFAEQCGGVPFCGMP